MVILVDFGSPQSLGQDFFLAEFPSELEPVGYVHGMFSEIMIRG